MLNHGINIKEDDGVRREVSTPAYGATVVAGTAPIHFLDDPLTAVNTPIVVESLDEAERKLGFSTAFQKYTLCQSMEMSLGVFGTAPMVFINVLDPAKHTKELPEKELNITDGQVVLAEEGVLFSELKVVSDTDTELVRDRDYILSRDGEIVTITLIGEGASGITSVKVTGKLLDASMVTKEDVIGGYDSETGSQSGLELIRQVYPMSGYTPSLLIAPGYSHYPEVAAVMEAKCEEINGCFRCECIVDLDTQLCKKYDDVAEEKERLGVFSRHTYAVWPMAKRNGRLFYGSAVAAAVTQYTDQDNDGIVSKSPSNKSANIDAAVLQDGSEVALDFAAADVVNNAGVGCFINNNGWKLWGNATAAFPEDKNKKAKFWNIRRFFSWRANKFITDYLTKIDLNGDRRLLDSICDEENMECNALVGMGVCAAASIQFLDSDNKGEDLADGMLVFRQSYAPYFPTQNITNILALDTASVVAALTTGGES